MTHRKIIKHSANWPLIHNNTAQIESNSSILFSCNSKQKWCLCYKTRLSLIKELVSNSLPWYIFKYHLTPDSCFYNLDPAGATGRNHTDLSLQPNIKKYLLILMYDLSEFRNSAINAIFSSCYERQWSVRGLEWLFWVLQTVMMRTGIIITIAEYCEN